MHPAEDHELGLRLRGKAGQPKGVASRVSPPHHLVSLVVVPQDHQARPEGLLGRFDPPRQVLACRCDITLREGCLKPKHWNLQMERTSMWSAGTARAPIRGDVDLEVDMWP